jgi:SAM-dependent methyltransferase
VRDRFTHTVGHFARSVQSRAQETERLVAMATANFASAATAIAMDLACGPATFARAFAPRVGRVIGVDFTPAMLAEARRVAQSANLSNLQFVCADGYALPFADATLDLALCAYAIHHLLEPAKVLFEMARVVRTGGRIGIVDVIVPDGADRELHNRIERLRDPSHATTLSAGGLRDLLRAADLRVIAAEQHARERDLDDWMRGAGWVPGSKVYEETRKLMEDSQTNDDAGFAPHFSPDGGALLMKQVALSLVAEKK